MCLNLTDFNPPPYFGLLSMCSQRPLMRRMPEVKKQSTALLFCVYEGLRYNGSFVNWTRPTVRTLRSQILETPPFQVTRCDRGKDICKTLRDTCLRTMLTLQKCCFQ